MSSFVVSEALVVGLKEGLKLGIVWLVFGAFCMNRSQERLVRTFFAAGLFAFPLALSGLLLTLTPAVKEVAGNVILTSFALFFLGSGIALLEASGFVRHSPLKNYALREGMLQSLVFALTVVFFLPDGVGIVLFLKDLSVLKEAAVPTFASAFAGFGAGFLSCSLIARKIRRDKLGDFFGLPQLLLFLAIVKLLGSGTAGYSELSLVPEVQRRLMKFSHDLIHQTFVMLMVPDHPLLKTTTWNFIGFFFGPTLSSWGALLLLILLPVYFLYESLTSSFPASHGLRPADRRKGINRLLSDRRKKALPIIIFIVFVMATWFSGSGESVSKLYNPRPKPVVADKGVILIPTNDPTMDLKDGAIHKFSLVQGAEEIRLLVVRKGSGVLAVCLDACEICPPDGYGQRKEHVICIYCNTPIPVETLGEPGGCNPIPLVAAVDEKFVRIDVAEVLRKWELVKAGVKKEMPR